MCNKSLKNYGTRKIKRSYEFNLHLVNRTQTNAYLFAYATFCIVNIIYAESLYLFKEKQNEPIVKAYCDLTVINCTQIG